MISQAKPIATAVPLSTLGAFERLGRSGQRSFRRIEQSTSGQRYRTSQSGVLSAQGTATITLKAVQGGAKGNASAGALLTLAGTVVGVSPRQKWRQADWWEVRRKS